MFVAWRNNIMVLYLRNDATYNMGVVVTVYVKRPNQAFIYINTETIKISMLVRVQLKL